MEKEIKIINRLFDEWVISKSYLFEFDKLFSENKQLNKIHEKFLDDFFQTIGDLFWNYFLINIAKLLDPSTQGGFKNLSLYILVDILKDNGKLEKANELKVRLDKFKNTNNSIIQYRRKNLAHFDLDFSIGEKKFNSTTDIKQLYSIYDEVIGIINFSLKALNLNEKSNVIINHGKFKGANQLNTILMEYNELYLSKLNQ